MEIRALFFACRSLETKAVNKNTFITITYQRMLNFEMLFPFCKRLIKLASSSDNWLKDYQVYLFIIENILCLGANIELNWSHLHIYMSIVQKYWWNVNEWRKLGGSVFAIWDLQSFLWYEFSLQCRRYFRAERSINQLVFDAAILDCNLMLDR